MPDLFRRLNHRVLWRASLVLLALALFAWMALPKRQTSVYVSPDIPTDVRDALQAWIRAHPHDYTWSTSPQAGLVLALRPTSNATPIAERVLVPAAHFGTLVDDLSLADLRRLWAGDLTAWNDLRLSGRPTLVIDPETESELAIALGPRNPAAPVEIVTRESVAQRVWDLRTVLAILPFDHLEPRLKVLSVDGLLATDKHLDIGRYPLTLHIWAQGAQDAAEPLHVALQETGVATNRDIRRMATVVMSGTTALTRITAQRIELHHDYAYPARLIADRLRDAEVIHVSNEVSFSRDCQPKLDTMIFCSRPEYLATLQLLGTNVVELTGNHNNDAGAAAALASLDLYRQLGMQYFGGGRDAQDARHVLVVEANGNRLAFVGYNQAGPDYAWAGPNTPGAARFDPATLPADLENARSLADVVFVDIQHTEAYQPGPLPEQRRDFRLAAELGADIVTGTQAHQPQGVAFHAGKLILYGLGNLFFDQMWSDSTRQGLIARHTIYHGRHLSTELLTTIIEDYAQPRWAEGAERRAILQTVFAASEW